MANALEVTSSAITTALRDAGVYGKLCRLRERHPELLSEVEELLCALRSGIDGAAERLHPGRPDLKLVRSRY